MKKRIIILLIFVFSITMICFMPDILSYLRCECFWKKYFGIYCAGCGVTRMIKAITQFKFYQAFCCNQLFFTLTCLLIIYLIYYFICKIKKRMPFIPKSKTFIFIAFIMILYMILRNINYFSYLRPINIS